LPRAAVPDVGARPGRDVHDRAGVTPVLRVIGVRENLEFLDGVGRRPQHEAGVERIVVRRAVEQEVVRLVALAVDVERAGDVAEPARWRVAVLTAEPGRGRPDAGNERAELREVPAVQWKIDHLLPIDDDTQRGVGRFDERRLARHIHLLLDLTDLQHDIPAYGFVDDDRDVVADRRAESGERRPHLIDARIDQRDGEEAVGTRDGRAYLTGVAVRDVDRDAGKNPTRRVGGDAGHGACRPG